MNFTIAGFSTRICPGGKINEAFGLSPLTVAKAEPVTSVSTPGAWAFALNRAFCTDIRLNDV